MKLSLSSYYNIANAKYSSNTSSSKVQSTVTDAITSATTSKYKSAVKVDISQNEQILNSLVNMLGGNKSSSKNNLMSRLQISPS